MYNKRAQLIASQVSQNDETRLKLLWEEARSQARLNEGDFIELGVYRGGSAILLAQALRSVGSRHRLHLLDSWSGLPAPTAEDIGTIASEGGFNNASPEQVAALLQELELEDLSVFHVGDFRETLPQISGPFALAHVDCDFYESMRYCLNDLLPRMTPHGVIVIDDYGSADMRNFPGVKRAVDECIAGTNWGLIYLGGEFDQSVKLVRAE